MQRRSWRSLLRDQCGQDLVEYALLAGIIALGAVAAVHTLSNTYANVPDYLLNKLISSW